MTTLDAQPAPALAPATVHRADPAGPHRHRRAAQDARHPVRLLDVASIAIVSLLTTGAVIAWADRRS